MIFIDLEKAYDMVLKDLMRENYQWRYQWRAR